MGTSLCSLCPRSSCVPPLCHYAPNMYIASVSISAVSVLLSYRLFNIVSPKSVNLRTSAGWFRQGCPSDPQTMIVTTSVLISIFLITHVVDRIWVISVDFSSSSSESFGSVEENVWRHAVYFPTTTVCVFIMFFKCLNLRTSAGLLFAQLIIHLMKAVFLFKYIFLLNVYNNSVNILMTNCLRFLFMLYKMQRGLAIWGMKWNNAMWNWVTTVQKSH